MFPETAPKRAPRATRREFIYPKAKQAFADALAESDTLAESDALSVHTVWSSDSRKIDERVLCNQPTLRHHRYTPIPLCAVFGEAVGSISRAQSVGPAGS